ncbi:hypothetical protein BD410DRAFT_818641 [Rickenella mellea]|uniref:Exocyst complex component Sec8 n=1 Tax=Rickenella mellea TaxID=50990 RepID=A0A4Y7QKL4_9AGAM|nr:hypothetical protein BD410DRAFT_818641 [Rickenella mellea]
MSRAHPFPTNIRRPGTPSNDPNSSSQSNVTLPLSINRTPGPSRPISRNGSNSPARPVRSDLRPRQISQYSTSSLSMSNVSRDSFETSRTTATSMSGGQRSRQKPELNGARDEPEMSPVSPEALSAVMSAFQSAGRKRAMTNGTAERERELAEEQKNQKRIRDKAVARRPNGKARAGDIDAILDQIKDDWEFVIDPDFNPVDLALQLLDSSAKGKRMDSFRRTKDMLSRALQGSVDKHYQAFAAALPHHAGLLTHLSTAQTHITDARTALQEAKDALGNKRSDLVQLWSRGQTIDEMLRLMDQIENLKSVPDVLESLMTEKRLLDASVLLIRSLKTINKPDLLEIGAVADLRAYLTGQENALREILIDELHSHLYLKCFWCDTRWAPYTPNQQSLPRVPYDIEPLPSEVDNYPSSSSSPPQPRLSRFLNDLTLRPNDPPYDLSEQEISPGGNRPGSMSNPSKLGSTNFVSESARTPESDSFAYMETLLESLSVLGKLGSSLDVIGQRLPSEINSLIELTIDDISERVELGRRLSSYGSNPRPSSVYVFSGDKGSAQLSSTLLSPSSLRLASLESMEKQMDHEILRDFFWTLYSKLDAVLQGLRVVYEVANRIGSRRDFKDSTGAKPGTLFPIVDIWVPIQTEVRTLLNDYLSDEEKGAAPGRNPISSINEVLREGKFTRDKNKQVFRFADTALKSATKVLRQHEDELTRVLKETVPGLVQGTSDSAVQTTLSNVGSDDRLIGVERHRQLLHADAFHVSVLFQPTLVFLNRVADVLPSGLESARASTVVLDEFVLNVYLPQLEEKTSVLFHQAVTGPDAFQADPASSRLSPEPLIKASTQLMALINSLCAMLRTTPFHRESYARLILGVIIQFYQRCSDTFYAVVSQEGPNPTDTRLHVSARWAQNADINACLTNLTKCMQMGGSRLDKMCAEETRMELASLGNGTLTRDELIHSMRDISCLGSLYRSLVWFIDQLQTLKSHVEEPFSPADPGTPQLPALPPIVPNEELHLPLSREMALRFDALLKTYEQLAELILYTIRLEVRCRTIYYIDLAMRHGNYCIDHEAGEPDPHIVDLNAELGRCDECLTITIPEMQRRFVFAGLEPLMEQLLISNARHIRVANSFGIKKIMRNILALRQNNKTMSGGPRDSEFRRARQYFSLFAVGPATMLKSIKSFQSYSFDEYEAMLNLQCGIDKSLGDSGVAHASDKNYNMYVIELRGLELGAA